MKMDQFKGIHDNEPCWIIGNGPSLKKMDLGFLRNQITFGMNCIYLGFGMLGVVPTYYTVEDNFVAEDNHAKISSLDNMIKFIPKDLSYCLDDNVKTCWVNFKRQYQPYPQFSDNCDEVVFWGSTVTYLAIQLAYYMGCNPVYLIGVDFDYKIPLYAEGQEITSREDDINHFHPDYFGKGKRWHHPRLDRVKPAYEKARDYFADRNRTILNATVGGKLDVFERVDYREILNRDKN